MATSLTSATVRRIAALFPESQHAEVAELLVAECGDNLPFADTLGEAGVERIRFAVLRLSDGSLDRLWDEVDLVQLDWRDALVEAGFGDDEQSHSAWLADAKPFNSSGYQDSVH